MATVTKKKQVAAGFDPMQGVFVDADGKPVVKSVGTRPAPVSPVGFKIDTRSVFDKDLSGVVFRDADGFHAANAGKKSYGFKPRKVYSRGSRWRVVAENVRMEMMCHYGANANGTPLYSGQSLLLPAGTELECIGWRRFRKGGMVAPQFTFDGLPAETIWSTVWPKDSVFRTWPLTGILEPITEDVAE